jgi:hypothetical protein
MAGVTGGPRYAGRRGDEAAAIVASSLGDCRSHDADDARVPETIRSHQRRLQGPVAGGSDEVDVAGVDHDARRVAAAGAAPAGCLNPCIVVDGVTVSTPKVAVWLLSGLVEADFVGEDHRLDAVAEVELHQDRLRLPLSGRGPLT